MRRLVVAVSTVALGATLAVTPNAAVAATTQFGNGCFASNYAENVTVVATAGAPSNPIPATSPSTGVITKATLLLPAEAGVGPYPVKVKTVRATGLPGSYTVISESGVINTAGGSQTRDVRLPVRAGDLLGLGGPGALVCETGNVADTVALFDSDVTPGTTAVATGTDDSTSVPVVVTVEPDVDKDGFGDVTQDLCPQSAAVQTACPKLKLDIFAVGQGGSVLALVGTSTPAKVKVTGSAQVNGKTVKLSAKPKTVKPGTFGRFKLTIPAELRAALAKLPPSRAIKVTFVARATDITGKRVKDKTSLLLRGTR
jgi:hypothetical protein